MFFDKIDEVLEDPKNAYICVCASECKFHNTQDLVHSELYLEMKSISNFITPLFDRYFHISRSGYLAILSKESASYRRMQSSQPGEYIFDRERWEVVKKVASALYPHPNEICRITSHLYWTNMKGIPPYDDYYMTIVRPAKV